MIGWWIETHKGDAECRLLADGHYSRQTIGAPMFCRPGYNMVLKTRNGSAVWVWHRPKWESGIKGTERKDGLRAIENTLFRNTSKLLSSELIKEACEWLLLWKHANDTAWPDGAITGIKSSATSKRRSKRALPGKCYREAGWVEFEHRKSNRSDVWLKAPQTGEGK